MERVIKLAIAAHRLREGARANPEAAPGLLKLATAYRALARLLIAEIIQAAFKGERP